jgi:hypothetical protein
MLAGFGLARVVKSTVAPQLKDSSEPSSGSPS